MRFYYLIKHTFISIGYILPLQKEQDDEIEIEFNFYANIKKTGMLYIKHDVYFVHTVLIIGLIGLKYVCPTLNKFTNILLKCTLSCHRVGSPLLVLDGACCGRTSCSYPDRPVIKRTSLDLYGIYAYTIDQFGRSHHSKI